MPLSWQQMPRRQTWNTDQVLPASEAGAHQFTNPLVLVKLRARRVWNVQITTAAGIHIPLSMSAETTRTVNSMRQWRTILLANLLLKQVSTVTERPHDALHHGQRVVNKGTWCDKPAMVKLSSQDDGQRPTAKKKKID